jgi:hypothetical protein
MQFLVLKFVNKVHQLLFADIKCYLLFFSPPLLLVVFLFFILMAKLLE